LNPDSTRQMIDDVIKVVIKDMQKNGLLSPK
jgi:predicted RNase H-like HicB family nuclease